jgi:hypothetical protein
MKTSKKGFVEVPTTTLNALKNMLFSAEGVDLSAIVNDLAASDDQKDLMAINVALTYKGVQIDIDKRTHYEYDWKNRYNRFEYVGYSLILGIVKVQRTLVEVAENGEEKVVSTYDNIECYGFDQWEALDTDLSAIYAKIAERTK